MSLALICTFCLSLAEADGEALHQQGMAVYLAQDYETAFEIWFPLAETGNAEAQNGVGVLYDNGWGVEQDYEKAADYFLKAVELGETNLAQAFFDQMVEEGKIPADYTPREI